MATGGVADSILIRLVKYLQQKTLRLYPEMQGNIHTQKLLNQIESTERERLSVKLRYTDIVASYNAKIHSFPIAIIRIICKWEDIGIEFKLTEEELVSDEELGI